jgi:ABC-2 family transporter protein
MNLFPIFASGLRAEMRKHRLRKARLAAGATAGLTLVVLVLVDRWAGGLNVTRVLRLVPLAGFGPFALLVIGLNRGADLLSVERREGTLPLLLLTHLTGYDIVLGKLLQALVVELSQILATVPALVLPLIAVGFGLHELWLITLGCLNVLFCAVAIGLLASVFGNGSKAASWCLLLLLPLLAYSTPLASLLPGGAWFASLAALQVFNPCAALMHVQTAAAGLRPGACWLALLTSHVVGWGWLALAGWFLPRACRWQAGVAAKHPAQKSRWPRWIGLWNRAPEWRTRLLNRNPFLWLTSREGGPTVQVWLLLILPTAAWGWLTWLTWARRGLNIAIVLVIAAAASWLVSLLAIIPREASRRLVEDRDSGALELLLCTPLAAKGIVRGQWLCLSRRYLLPVMAVMGISSALMIAGYTTFGFGGMLDPEDRGRWLFSWSAGILLLPVCLVSVSWVAMRRALFARSAGEASAIAWLQAVGVPGFALWAVYWLSVWAGLDPSWWWLALLFASAFVGAPVALACRARGILLAKLPESAANRYSADSLT